MDGSTDNILEKIKQYQKSIIKHSELRNDAKILSYISKLYDMPVTVAHLQDTGIGRTINSLRKYNGDVGTASKAIVYKWKNMVAREEEAEEAAVEANRRSSVDESENTPPPTPPNVDRKKRKHSTEEKDKKKSHEKRHKRESPERRSRSKERENENRTKSHHRKDEKRDSHKSSHSHSKVKEVSDRHIKEDKSKHDKKRKLEEERSPAKKKKYEDSDSDESNRLLIQENSLDSTVLSDDNIQPTQENSRENTQSPIESTSSSPRKKGHKSSNRDKESSKKEQNGSKVSSHRDKSSYSKKGKDAKSNSTKEKSKESPKKPKPAAIATKIIHGDNGIDSGSGASFAEALGMITPSSSKAVFKKKTLSSSPTPSTSSTTVIKAAKSVKSPSSSVTTSQNSNVDLLAPNTKLEPLDLNIIPPIPEITTNYKPLTTSNYTYDSFSAKIKNMTEEEALCAVISSKTQRTKVYSGNKTNCGFVPSLFQLCVRILQDNIDALEYTGGVPYEILKPVLERATANQLLNTEYFNPYLIEESDILWEKHCKRECRGQQKQELESWRDMYLRCRDEREAKLRTLTSNIKQSIDKSVPVRQTKLAYVDNAKPPRNIARKQAKYGTNVVTKPFMTPSARLNAIASGSGEKIHVPAPARVSTATIKPKKAPLMQKTLALIKSRFRR